MKFLFISLSLSLPRHFSLAAEIPSRGEAGGKFLPSLSSHSLPLFPLFLFLLSPSLSLATENFRREENFSPSSPSLATEIISVAREEFPLFLSSFLSSLLPHSPRLSLATEISVARTSPFLPPHFFFFSFLLSPTISSPSFPSLATEINSVAQEEFSLLAPLFRARGRNNGDGK